MVVSKYCTCEDTSGVRTESTERIASTVYVPMRKKGSNVCVRACRVGQLHDQACELDGCMLAPQGAKDDWEKEEKENEKDAETIREKPNPRT